VSRGARTESLMMMEAVDQGVIGSEGGIRAEEKRTPLFFRALRPRCDPNNCKEIAKIRLLAAQEPRLKSIFDKDFQREPSRRKNFLLSPARLPFRHFGFVPGQGWYCLSSRVWWQVDRRFAGWAKKCPLIAETAMAGMGVSCWNARHTSLPLPNRSCVPSVATMWESSLMPNQNGGLDTRSFRTWTDVSLYIRSLAQLRRRGR
jgi:hypothetical protein